MTVEESCCCMMQWVVKFSHCILQRGDMTPCWSQIFPLQNAVGSQILPLHHAAGSQILPPHDAAGSQFGNGTSSLKTLEDSLGP
jgi:hypothetical protein